mgnify:CR=1 FL=1
MRSALLVTSDDRRASSPSTSPRSTCSSADRPPPRIRVSRTFAMRSTKTVLLVLAADISIASGNGTPAFASAGDSSRSPLPSAVQPGVSSLG